MRGKVESGIDRLQTIREKIRNRRLGLMTNPTGVDGSCASTIDIVNGAYTLTALFSCEHGIRGDAQAGKDIDTYIDPETNVPVYSVYGAGRLRMTPEMTETFDVLLFDMQDVGARFYTYLYSLSYAMEACAAAGKPVVVLDRINPIGGVKTEGLMLDERMRSFVGEYEMPARYALTIGEYALWVKRHLGLSNLDLTVVPLSGWKRSMYLDDTGLCWVAPSPNCATLQAALCYPGTCIFEGTNLSEGRGTTLPFEWVGAPWVDSKALESRMNAMEIPGVRFRRCCFTPTFSKHEGELCKGVQIHIVDRDRAEIFRAGFLLLEEIRALHGDCFAFREGTKEGPWAIDRLLGTDEYRLGKADARELIERHRPRVEEFARQKAEFELYR